MPKKNEPSIQRETKKKRGSESSALKKLLKDSAIRDRRASDFRAEMVVGMQILNETQAQLAGVVERVTEATIAGNRLTAKYIDKSVDNAEALAGGLEEVRRSVEELQDRVKEMSIEVRVLGISILGLMIDDGENVDPESLNDIVDKMSEAARKVVADAEAGEGESIMDLMDTSDVVVFGDRGEL